MKRIAPRRLRRLALAAAGVLAASPALLRGQSILVPDASEVKSLDGYRQLGWLPEGFVPPPLMPAGGTQPLLALADLLDLRDQYLNFAGEGVPRQAVFVAREIVLGNTQAGLRGQEPVTWPPAAAAAAAGKEVHADGGFLILVADTLRLDAGADFVPMMSPPLLRVDATAGGEGVDRGYDGGLALAFRHLILSEALAKEVCRPALESADLIPPDSQGKIRLALLDRDLLGAFFSPQNERFQRLRNEASGAWEPQALRDEIQGACRWEIEQAPERVVRPLVKLVTSASLYSLDPEKLRELETERTLVTTRFGALADFMPIRRVTTLWAIAYFRHLGQLLQEAAARSDAAAVAAVLDRFEHAPGEQPDPALADDWTAARIPLRRAAAYYRPASPGSRIVARLPGNVVLIEATKQAGRPPEPGCGFVIGRSADGGQVYLLTAGHVVEGAGAVKVGFWSDDLTPRQVAASEAAIVPPRGEVAIDLALLSAPVPPGWSWKADVDGDSAKLAVKSPVWSISAAAQVVLPALDVGVVRVPADKTGVIEAEGLVALGGNSGCPLVADSGIVGMLVERTEQGEAQALPISLVRDTVREHWGIPWGLTPASPENRP
jgi:hypothetical protein